MSIELTRAEPFAAPIVERLSVRVIVDSSYDRFISDASHPMVAIEHVRHIPGHELSTFAGEWGLSYFWNRLRRATNPSIFWISALRRKY